MDRQQCARLEVGDRIAFMRSVHESQLIEGRIVKLHADGFMVMADDTAKGFEELVWRDYVIGHRN